MATIVFYSPVPPSALNKVEFYKQDIDALGALGHRVVICTKLWEIPASFDAIFVWWWSSAFVPVLLCRILKKPCIVTGTFDFRFPDSFQGRDYFRRPFWQRFLIKFAAKHCSLNLFVNQLELQDCSKYFGLKNVGFLPHCVSDDYLRGPSTKRNMALFNLAWCSKENLIRKGIPEILKAVRLLKDRGQEVHLYLAGGEGDGRSYLIRMIQDLGIKNEVHYLGNLQREDKIRMLRENEIYVQPSHYEGFGVAILESMGCGGCVIVRDVGAVKEVVGDCGFYLTSSDPEELALAILKLQRDAGLRRRLQSGAVERARSLFTFKKKVETLGAFLRELRVE
jgi:glycosyltransferase involved in cell wall biosynthesis